MIFPYRYHFSTVNNHVLVFEKINGNFLNDKQKVISALRKGQNYIANDLIANAKGFRFYFEDEHGKYSEMGDVLNLMKN